MKYGLSFWWYCKTFPIRRSYWRFRSWMTEASTIDEMIAQGKVIVHVARVNPNIKRYILVREPTRKERSIWDAFQETQAI
jgi:hypothetical protein